MSEAPKTLAEAYESMMAKRSEPSAPENSTPPETNTATTEVTTEVPEAVATTTDTQAVQPDTKETVDPYEVIGRQTEALKSVTNIARQAQEQNQSMTEELQRLRSAMNEQNKAAETAEIREAVTPPVPPQMPNFDDLAYLSEAEKQSKQADYMNAMAQYIKQQAMADMQPYLDKVKEVELRDAEDAILTKFSDPASGYADFSEYIPMIKNIIQNNPLISGADMSDDKYLTAYAIAKGIKANEPKPAKLKLTDEDKQLLSNEELLEIYKSNRDLQKLIAQEQIGSVREAENVPPFTASGDAANVALNTQTKPKNFEDARKGMMQKIMALRGGIK